MAKHVQIGAGKLGLGLLGDISFDLRLGTVFLNRRSEASALRNAQLARAREYCLNATDSPSKIVSGFTLHMFDEHDIADAALAALCDASVILVTVSIGWEHMNSLIAPLARALNHRFFIHGDGASPLFVVACENRFKASETLGLGIRAVAERDTEQFAALLAALDDRRLVFPNCVVDRVCSDVTYESTGVTVKTEQYRRWAIDSALTEPLHVLLADCNGVEFVTNIEAQEKLKLWGVNGLHLVAAILAAVPDPPFDFISDAVSDSTIEPHVRMAATEIGEALTLKFPGSFDEQYLNTFFERIVHRFTVERTDTTARILKDLVLDQDRITRLAREMTRLIIQIFTENTAPAAVLEKTLRHSIHRAVYVFAAKVHERLIEPIVTLQESGRAPYLLSVPPLVLDLMNREGQRLLKQPAPGKG